jgi:hypothetical protein
LDGVVQKHGVYGLAHWVVATETERDVGHTAAHLGTGQVLLDPTRGVERDWTDFFEGSTPKGFFSFYPVDEEKRGKRNDTEEATDEEIKNTDKTRWERLPVGQNLLDLEITLDDFARNARAT